MDYREIERLAAKSERLGGYAHVSGPEDGPYFEVPDGDGGRAQIRGPHDCITFLQILLRRSQAREADPDNAVMKQQLDDGRREVAAGVRRALARFER